MLGKIAAPLAALAFLSMPTLGRAQTEFYKGKTLTIYIGYGVGGGYDVYGRIVARFIGKHIPGNPAVVVSNMEGAGSLRLANWLAEVAPKDGTAIGVITRGAAFDPLFGRTGLSFRGTDFAWVGSANNDVSVCVSWKTSAVKTFSDLMTKELIVGTTGAADDSEQFPKVINSTLGTKFKFVGGYRGANEALLAMERGEVEGRCGWSWSSVLTTRPEWVKNKTVNVLLQTALEKHPSIPDVPLVIDMAQNDEQRQILKLVLARQTMGRPFLAPPATDPKRLAELRKAFMDTMSDPEFLAAAAKENVEISAISGERVQDLVKEIYATPELIVNKAAAMLQ